MTVQIKFNKNLKKTNQANLVLFVNEKFDILTLKKHILSSEYSFISDLLKTRDLKKKIFYKFKMLYPKK